MATHPATRIETRQIELKSRPSGVPTEDNFRLGVGFIEPLEEGEFLVQNEWMSVDPYMRGWRTLGGGTRSHEGAWSDCFVRNDLDVQRNGTIYGPSQSV